MHETEKAAIDEAQVRLERTSADLTAKLWPLVLKHFPDAISAVLMVGERSDFAVPDGRLPITVCTLVLGPREAHADCLKAAALDVSRSGQVQLEAALRKMQ